MTESILAIETSSEHCSVALNNRGEISSDSSTIPRGHASRLLPMINDLISSQGVELKQLDAIAVSNGPGAFTSIRIGTAVCQGLAAAIDCPVITASSLEVMALDALQQSELDHVLVALDARMDEVYFGAYQRSEQHIIEAIQPDQVAAPGVINTEQLSSDHPWGSAGIGWQVYEEAMHAQFKNLEISPIALQFPDARALLTLAQHRYQRQQYQDVRTLRPVYLRDNVVNT